MLKCEGKITLVNADNEQDSLLLKIVAFNKETKPRSFSEKKQERDTLDSVNGLYEGRKVVLNAFTSGIFSLQHTEFRMDNFFLFSSKGLTLQTW